MALLVAVVLDINVKNYKYSPKKKEKKADQGLETSHVSSPIFLPPAAALLSQLLRLLLVLVVLVWCGGVAMIAGPKQRCKSINNSV